MPPIKFHPNGCIEVDTAEEAALFDALRALERAKAATKAGRVTTALSGWDGFYDLIAKATKREPAKVLALVKGRGGVGISVDDLAKQSGLPVTSIVGAMGSIAKRASQVGLELKRLSQP